MAIHNAWLIEFILFYFRDHFPLRKSEDLMTDILHSTFPAGKQLSLTHVIFLFPDVEVSRALQCGNKS